MKLFTVLCVLLTACSYSFAGNIIINNVSNAKTIKDDSSYVNTGIDLGQNSNENYIKGNGKTETKTFELPSFNSIVIDIPFSVSIVCGKSPQLTITAESNIIPLIKYDVKNSELKISIENSFSGNGEITVLINAPDVNKITSDSSSQIAITGINNSGFAIFNSGSSEISASGETGNLKIVSDGSGMISLKNLKSENADITFSGAGVADVYASQKLTANISGAVEVNYFGNPREVINKSETEGLLSKGE